MNQKRTYRLWDACPFKGILTILLCSAVWSPLAQAQRSGERSGADSARKAKEFFINGTTLLLQGGRAAEAILEFQQALRFDTTAACLAAIARSYVELGKLELAHEYVTMALARNKESSDSWELLAEIEVQRGRYDEGLLAYEQILSLKPTRRQIQTLARLYEPRNARRAIELYEQLLETKSDLFVLERLSELYQRLNDDV
ncbi:MAG: tetratricopeptide repeat protein, partial [Candidatus Kapabacteria bacterium]|nr:tetratricopeptide repeat protein [Candidatus Kapabacteria bacterium]